MKGALVVVAHPDDEVLGCGGTTARMTSSGGVSTACVLVGNADARSAKPATGQLTEHTIEAQTILNASNPIVGDFPNIKLNTVPHLDLVQFIEAAIVATSPQLIFTHHPADLNDDHRQTSAACQAAARLFQRDTEVPALRGLYYMEVLSSTDWSFAHGSERFVPDTYVEIRDQGLSAKLQALAAYEGVMRPYPHPRSTESIRALAVHRGSQARMDLAEAFQTAFFDLGLALGR